MIDINNLARRLATDLTQSAGVDSAQVEDVVRDAFQRGLDLGLSMRMADSGAASPLHNPARREVAPCAPTY